ncbi:MAG: SDR family NAD(P)-dependent oxidoreductase [Candidatus Eisenbacteria bacterium]|uniref:SDR family NAD(P)-dependent oxidoreductase n=1 Tax=Eiseniibacteriota bacterium TaxID=2212470 RepID=A0A538SVH4_UNCEI|nr:MAG: SDR family NAD(P)-dependent oxidoreductase [Candidatus Eisenbacteria bacterium]
MQLASNTVLITGGASGIGFALAERFLRAGSEVIICGRREEKLAEARAKHPGLKTRVCDLAKETQRAALHKWVTNEFPRLNVLVNNAGIQRRVQLPEDLKWKPTHEEIAINLEAPVHLSALFVPHLKKQEHPSIMNVTSGLSFAPMANVPIYCATKAALHSFTLSLRHQLSSTPIRVIEIIPPAVNTDLGGPGLHTFGLPVEEFVNAVMVGLQEGNPEIAYGYSQRASRASRAELDEIFQRMNQVAH